MTWEQVSDPVGDVVALEFKGYAARPLCRAEDGLHRLISADGNAVVDVWELEEYGDWPWSHKLDTSRPRSYIARSYNYRTREVTMPTVEAVKLDADDPFALLESAIEDIVWRITDSEWE